LSHFNLVEIFRSIVVDRRPEQTAQVAQLSGNCQSRWMCIEAGDLLLSLRRKVGIETSRAHYLARNRAQIGRTRAGVIHGVSCSCGNELSRLGRNYLLRVDLSTIASTGAFFAFFFEPRFLRPAAPPMISATLVLSRILAAASRTSRKTP